MRLIDKIIIYTTIFALFTEDFYFFYMVQWKLFYLIIIVNLLLLLAKNKIVLHKNMLFVFAFFSLHAVILFLYLKNPFTSFLAQLLGISLSSIYFYSFLKNYGTKLAFKVYLKFAFVISVLAIPMFFLKINSFDAYRLNGIMSEPAHYAAIMLPALYVFLKEKQFFRFSIVLITIILSQSSLGYLGILLIIVLPLIKIKYALKYSIIVLIILLFSINFIRQNWENENETTVTSQIVMRIKQTYESLEAVKTGEFEKYTNLSSYAVLSNLFITRQNLLEHPLGTGLGSYRHQYDFYFNKMSPPPYLIPQDLHKINRDDASSLLLRLFSDLGLFALLFFGIFCLTGLRLMSGNNFIRQGTFFYLILKVIREGHYFPPEFYFFLMIFLKDFDEDTIHAKRLFNAT